MTTPVTDLSAAPACCAEYAVSRRGLLRGGLGGLALAGTTAVVGTTVVTTSPALGAPADAVLVVLSLRGAADGLSLVVPHGDPAYAAARPRIAVPTASLLARDDLFGLHPALAPLLPLWSSGRLAAIHATGMPVANRSHFAAMEEVEDADPGSRRREGWLNRLVATMPGRSPLQGFHLGDGVVPTSLVGRQPTFAAGDVGRVEIPGDDEWDEKEGRRRSLRTMWQGDRSPLGRGMAATFDAVDGFAPAQAVADPAERYPDSDLGRALSQVARVLRGDVGVEVVTVDHGDWDHHTDIGNLEWGQLRARAGELAGAVAAFFDDLGGPGGLGEKVTLVTLSEFGRRVRENDNWGLDHGYGNVMLVAGAGVRGGRYYGSWPGLTNSMDADLLVTTDYRNVLGEIVATRFAHASIGSVFPRFRYQPVGFMRAG